MAKDSYAMSSELQRHVDGIPCHAEGPASCGGNSYIVLMDWTPTSLEGWSNIYISSEINGSKMSDGIRHIVGHVTSGRFVKKFFQVDWSANAVNGGSIETVKRDFDIRR